MNLPDKANETCVAQIAEALFGQPGMSLMEMANRRAEIEAMRKDELRFSFCAVHGIFPVRTSGVPGWVMFIAIKSRRRESYFGANSRAAIDAAMAAMKEQAE